MSALTPFLVFVLLCSGCFSPPRPPLSASRATLAWLDQHYGVLDLPESHPVFERLRSRLGAAIASRSDAPTAAAEPWHLLILRAEQPNAFCLDGGYVVITVGLLQALTSEAQLASVVAHEMSHQLLAHTAEAYHARNVDSLTPNLHFTLEQELAADALGLELLARARYEASEAAAALAIPYRTLQGKVSSEAQAGLQLRIATLYGNYHQLGPLLGATKDTREFHQLQNALRARR